MFLIEFAKAHKDAAAAVVRKRVVFGGSGLRSRVSFYIVRVIMPWLYGRKLAAALLGEKDFHARGRNFAQNVALNGELAAAVKDLAKHIIEDSASEIEAQKEVGRKKIIFAPTQQIEIWELIREDVRQSLSLNAIETDIDVDALCWINLASEENWEETARSNADGLFWHRDLDYPVCLKVFLEVNLETFEIKNHVEYAAENENSIFTGYRRMSKLPDDVAVARGKADHFLVVDTFQPHRGVRLPNDRLVIQFQLRPNPSWNWVGHNTVGTL